MCQPRVCKILADAWSPSDLRVPSAISLTVGNNSLYWASINILLLDLNPETLWDKTNYKISRLAQEKQSVPEVTLLVAKRTATVCFSSCEVTWTWLPRSHTLHHPFTNSFNKHVLSACYVVHGVHMVMSAGLQSDGGRPITPRGYAILEGGIWWTKHCGEWWDYTHLKPISVQKGHTKWFLGDG